MSAYGEYTTHLCEEKYLIEGLAAMGYRVEVHPNGAPLIGYHGDERPERAHVIIRLALICRVRAREEISSERSGRCPHTANTPRISAKRNT